MRFVPLEEAGGPAEPEPTAKPGLTFVPLGSEAISSPQAAQPKREVMLNGKLYSFGGQESLKIAKSLTNPSEDDIKMLGGTLIQPAAEATQPPAVAPEQKPGVFSTQAKMTPERWSNIGGRGNPDKKPESVMSGYVAGQRREEPLPIGVGRDITDPLIKTVEARLGSLPKEERDKALAGMAQRNDVYGRAAKVIQGKYQALDKTASPATTQAFDPRLEAQAGKLAVQGNMDPQAAKFFAQRDLRRGMMPNPLPLAVPDVDAEQAALEGERVRKEMEGAGFGERVGAEMGTRLRQTSIGAARVYADLAGDKGLQRDLNSWQKLESARGEAIPKGDSIAERSAQQAIATLGGQAPMMILGAMTGTAMPVLAQVGFETFMQNYGQGRSSNLSPAEASTRAGLMAVSELVFERYGLSDQLKAIRGVIDRVPTKDLSGYLAASLIKELPAEQATTLSQFMIDKLPQIGLGQNAGFKDYLEQAGETLRQTVIQTGSTNAAIYGASKAERTYSEKVLPAISRDRAIARAIDKGPSGTEPTIAALRGSSTLERPGPIPKPPEAPVSTRPSAKVAPETPVTPTEPVTPAPQTPAAPEVVPGMPTGEEVEEVSVTPVTQTPAPEQKPAAELPFTPTGKGPQFKGSVAPTQAAARLPDTPTVAPVKPVKAFEPPAPQHRDAELPTTDVSIKSLKLSQDVPQFKYGANTKGVVKPLGGKFSREGLAPIAVWERLDGSLEVISGRHRFDLAQRSGEETIPAQVYYESQGFTAKDAAIKDAELNVRDDQGQVKDYVNYFKESGMDRQTAESKGFLARDKGKRGFTIGNQGSDELIESLRADQISDEAAFYISLNAPNDAKLQTVGMKAVKDGKSVNMATNMMQAVKTLAGRKGVNIDMFGDDQQAILDAEEMATFAGKKQREIQNRLSAISGAAKRPEIAKSEGIDVNDLELVKNRVKELNRLKAKWDNWAENSEAISEINQALNIPAFELTSESESERQAREDKEAAEKEGKERKEIADREVDMFALTPSPAPEQETPPTEDMFAAKEPVKAEEPAEKVEPVKKSRAKKAKAEPTVSVENKPNEEDSGFRGASDQEVADVAKAFDKAQEAAADEGVTRVFDAPEKTDVVRLEEKTRVFVKGSGYMTVAQAKERIDEWKKNALAQGKTNRNVDKVVLSLFDTTGEWSKPWEEAGYQVYRFDIQDDPEFGDVNKFSTEFFNDIFGSFEGNDVYAILAACPCTDFASSGARHFAAKDASGQTVKAVQLVQQTLATIEYFKPSIWAVENPVGRIEKLTGLPPWRLAFNPNHFGDPYTKKTLLWGRFNADLPIAPVEPTEGSKMHRLYGGKSEATKNARSVTPEGFAYSFFMANNAVDHPVMAIANKYDMMDRGVFQKAIDAGMSERDISSVIDDLYYMDLDYKKAEQALDDKVESLKKEKAAPAKKPAAKKDGSAFILENIDRPGSANQDNDMAFGSATRRAEQIKQYATLRAALARVPKQVAEGKTSIDMQRNTTELIQMVRDLQTEIKITKPRLDSAEQFLSKALKEYDAGNISKDVLDVINTAYQKYPELLEGLLLRVRAAPERGMAAGGFAPINRMVLLYKGTSGAIDPRTIRHELAHSLEQMMTPEQRSVVVQAWGKAFQRAIKKYPDEAHQNYFNAVLDFLDSPTAFNYNKAQRLLPGYEMYQFITPSEFWAVNAEGLMDAQLGTPWDKFKRAIRRLWEGVKKVLGFDNRSDIHKVFGQVMGGNRERTTKTMVQDAIGEFKMPTLENIQDEKDLMDKYSRPHTPMLDNTPIKTFITNTYSNGKELITEAVTHPIQTSVAAEKGVTDGLLRFRNEHTWYGAGLESRDFARYNGQMRDATGAVVASVGLDNAIRSGNIAVQVIFSGELQYNAKMGNYVAVESKLGMHGVYKAEAAIKKRLGDQLGTDIVQGYLEAKRSLSIMDELAERGAALENATQNLEAMKALKMPPEEIARAQALVNDLTIDLEAINKAVTSVNMSDEEIADFIALEAKHPELREIMDNWTAVNQNLLKVWRQVGLLSQSRYDTLSAIKDYVPWYRIMSDEDIHSPGQTIQSTTRSMANIGREKLFKRGRPINVVDFRATAGQQDFTITPTSVVRVKVNGKRVSPDLVTATPDGKVRLDMALQENDLVVFETNREIQNIIDNMTRNVMRMTMNGIRQFAANRIVLEYATRNSNDKVSVYPSVSITEGRFEWIVNGKKVIVEIKDPLVVASIYGMENINLKMFAPMAALANLTRRSITLGAPFQVRQVFKDAPTAALVTGVRNPLALIGGVWKGFLTSLLQPAFKKAGVNIDPTIDILKAAGIGGFQDISRTPEAEIKRRLGIMNRNVYSMVIKGLDHIGDSSDMAQRAAVYNRVMAETGDQLQAIYQAQNIINFLHHGSAGYMQAAVKLVPFMGAWINSIDVLINSLQGGGLKGMSRKRALARLVVAGSMLSTMTLLYCMLAGGDPDYDELDDQTKLRNIIIPGTKVVLPMNTGPAFFFKAIPELIYNKITRDGTANENDSRRLRRALADVARDSLLGPVPIPAGFKPVLEVAINHSFFTGRPVVPESIKDVEAAEQYVASTSELGKKISALLAIPGTDGKRVINPVEADHLVRGLFGTAGAMAQWFANSVEASNRPAQTEREKPFTGSFKRDEVPRGNEDLFYDLKEVVMEKHETLKKLIERENFDEVDKFIEKNIELLTLHKYVTRTEDALKKVNKIIRRAGESTDKSVSPKERREEITDMQKLRNEILEPVKEFRRQAFTE